MPPPLPGGRQRWGANGNAYGSRLAECCSLHWLHGCSGHVFGFSGLDGDTSEVADFVAVVCGCEIGEEVYTIKHVVKDKF